MREGLWKILKEKLAELVDYLMNSLASLVLMMAKGIACILLIPFLLIFNDPFIILGLVGIRNYFDHFLGTIFSRMLTYSYVYPIPLGTFNRITLKMTFTKGEKYIINLYNKE